MAPRRSWPNNHTLRIIIAHINSNSASCSCFITPRRSWPSCGTGSTGARLRVYLQSGRKQNGTQHGGGLQSRYLNHLTAVPQFIFAHAACPDGPQCLLYAGGWGSGRGLGHTFGVTFRVAHSKNHRTIWSV